PPDDEEDGTAGFENVERGRHAVASDDEERIQVVPRNRLRDFILLLFDLVEDPTGEDAERQPHQFDERLDHDVARGIADVVVVGEGVEERLTEGAEKNRGQEHRDEKERVDGAHTGFSQIGCTLGRPSDESSIRAACALSTILSSSTTDGPTTSA